MLLSLYFSHKQNKILSFKLKTTIWNTIWYLNLQHLFKKYNKTLISDMEFKVKYLCCKKFKDTWYFLIYKVLVFVVGKNFYIELM